MAGTTDLEDLLQETLADFEELTPSAEVQTQKEQEPVAASSSQPEARETPTNLDESLHKEKPLVSEPKGPPKGLGVGLGAADPLGRRPRRATVASATAAPSGSSGCADQINGASGGGSAGDVKAGEQTSCKPARKTAERLATDVMSLLQEAGFGGESPGPQDAEELASCLANLMGTSHTAAAGASSSATANSASSAREAAPTTAAADVGAGEDDPFAQLFGRILGGLSPAAGAAAGGDESGMPPELAAMMQQMMSGPGGMAGGSRGMMGGLGGMMGTASAPGGAGAASGSAAADDDDALASSRLEGLAKHTRKTVAQQAKKTRGHVEGAATAQSAAAGAGAPFGGMLGGLALGGLGALGGLAGAGDESTAPGVNMMVDYIMQNLLSKDVLYGPLKEIRDRYPPWLEANQGKLPADDYKRYVAQYESVQKVCTHYETAPSDFATLMELIQEMQTYGDPPGDIVEEMTGGAGRDLNTVLAAAEAEEPEQHPALQQLSHELDNCKMQ